MPPPSVSPATPVWLTMPAGDREPERLALAVDVVVEAAAFDADGPCERVDHASRSSATGRSRCRRRRGRSPATACPPPRTAVSRSCSRAKRTAAITSATPRHRAMSAGRRSMWPFQTLRVVVVGRVARADQLAEEAGVEGFQRGRVECCHSCLLGSGARVTGCRPRARAGARTSPAPRPVAPAGARGGNRPSYGWYRFSTWRATVTLCTSVGPSAMPMIGTASHIADERHLVRARRASRGAAARACTTSCSTFGIAHLHRGDVRARTLLVVLVLVDLPRGVQHQQPELLDLDPASRRSSPAPSASRASTSPCVSRDERALAHHVERLLAHRRRCASRGGCGRRRGASARPRTPGPRRRAGSRPARARRRSGRSACVPSPARLAADADVADDLDARRVGRAR